MCGRTAQSRQGVEKGAGMLSNAPSSRAPSRGSGKGGGPQHFTNVIKASSETFDNSNLSPGMNALVFVKGTLVTSAPASPGPSAAHISRGRREGKGVLHDPAPTIKCTEKVWGLVTRGGTVQSPLPPGSTKHFSGLMFNARSDTLYDKRSFRDLALKGNTCVMAVDGFYEWKAPDKDTLGGGSGKQPYFVCRSDGLPLLIAGLWTSVPTGRKCGYDGRPEMLETFTLLTTDVCPKLSWLHSRMPVIIWDASLAAEWLLEPTQALEKKMAHFASNADVNEMSWHPVTKRMSSVQYRGDDCTKAIKIEKVPSVKSFFSRQFAVKKSVDGDRLDVVNSGQICSSAGSSPLARKAETGHKRPTPFTPANYPKKSAKAVYSSRAGTSTSERRSPAEKPLSPAKKGSITSFFASKR